MDETQVLYATPGFKGAAEFVADSLGVGKVVQDATVVDGIDLTVVLGQGLRGRGRQARRGDHDEPDDLDDGGDDFHWLTR